MAYDYAPITATASALLADFGQSVTIRSYAETTADPAAGTVTRNSTDTTANCVKTQFTQRNTPPGAQIEVGDFLAILDGEINIDDELVIGSQVWQVIDVFPVQPGASGVIWKAQIRGGRYVAPAEDFYVTHLGENVTNSGVQVTHTV